MHHVAMHDKTTLYLKDWGVGQPVILLSGWPLSADSWEDQAIDLVAAGYRVIAYDRRGFGRSSQPWSGYDYDTLSDDLAQVIQQTGAVDPVLIGFSMAGGEIARYLSRHTGNTVRKIVLVSSVVPYMRQSITNPYGAEPEIFESMLEQLREDRAMFFGEFFKRFFGVNLLNHPVSREVLDWAQNQAMQASLRATLECVKAFSSTDFREDLAAFQVPTLVIHGTADITVPIEATGRAAHRGIAHSTLIEYEDEPHGLFATDKLRLSRDLLGFLRA